MSAFKEGVYRAEDGTYRIVQATERGYVYLDGFTGRFLYDGRVPPESRGLTYVSMGEDYERYVADQFAHLQEYILKNREAILNTDQGV